MPLSAVVTDGPHNLRHQAHAANELLTGTVCADGFGVGWYGDAPEPARYVRRDPIWSDGALDGILRAVRSSCMMAAVRNATVAGANHEDHCAPFAAGRYLFSHNGFLDGWPAWQEEVVAMISPPRVQQLRGGTDSEHILAALLTRLDDMDPEPGTLATAVRGLAIDLRELGARLGEKAQLNFLASDGSQIVASRSGTESKQNSLYLLAGASSIVASEAFDDGWEPVDTDSLVVLQAGAPVVRMRC